MKKLIVPLIILVVVLGLAAVTAWVWPAWAVPHTNVHVTDPKEIPWLDQKPSDRGAMPLGELKSNP